MKSVFLNLKNSYNFVWQDNGINKLMETEILLENFNLINEKCVQLRGFHYCNSSFLRRKKNFN